MTQRKNEPERVWFRGERCFNADGKWYMATREGINIGPFTDRRSAERALAPYLAGLRARKDAKVAATGVARDVWANSNFL